MKVLVKQITIILRRLCFKSYLRSHLVLQLLWVIFSLQPAAGISRGECRKLVIENATSNLLGCFPGRSFQCWQFGPFGLERSNLFPWMSLKECTKATKVEQWSTTQAVLVRRTNRKKQAQKEILILKIINYFILLENLSPLQF